jgi:Nuclease A inhibitor-like protein
MPDPLLTTLQRATAGLQFPSEPAAPLEPFVWDEAELTPAAICRRTGHPAQAPSETITAEAFFADLAEVPGFPALYTTLQATLTDLRVYLLGELTITVVVVGRDAQGRRAGFTTQAVEA